MGVSGSAYALFTSEGVRKGQLSGYQAGKLQLQKPYKYYYQLLLLSNTIVCIGI